MAPRPVPYLVHPRTFDVHTVCVVMGKEYRGAAAVCDPTDERRVREGDDGSKEAEGREGAALWTGVKPTPAITILKVNLQ